MIPSVSRNRLLNKKLCTSDEQNQNISIPLIVLLFPNYNGESCFVYIYVQYYPKSQKNRSQNSPKKLGCLRCQQFLVSIEVFEALLRKYFFRTQITTNVIKDNFIGNILVGTEYFIPIRETSKIMSSTSRIFSGVDTATNLHGIYLTFLFKIQNPIFYSGKRMTHISIKFVCRFKNKSFNTQIIRN